MARMNFSARTSIAGGSASLARAIVNATRPKLQAAAEATGRDAAEQTARAAASSFGKRKGKPRSEPLADSARYTHRVNTQPRGVQLIFEVEGSNEFKAKFGALNYGSVPHSIAPRARGVLANPQDKGRPKRSHNGRFARNRGFFSTIPVTHPGTSGKRFWERACRAALDRFGDHL